MKPLVSRCENCGDPVHQSRRPGPRRKYCSPACGQRAMNGYISVSFRLTNRQRKILKQQVRAMNTRTRDVVQALVKSYISQVVERRGSDDAA